MSVVAFFALDIAGNLIISFINELGMLRFLNKMAEWGGHTGFWVGIVLLLIPAVLMFLATSYLLKHRLNLE